MQVETDKAVVNVPAPQSGTIKIKLPEGYTLHVGDTLAVIGTPAEISGTGPAATPSAQAAQPKTQPNTATAPPQKVEMQANQILAPPSVRKLARDLNVDISKVTGSGPAGRILEGDVRNFVSAPAEKTAAVPSAASSVPRIEGNVERIPLTPIRKAIAKNMELSWTIPKAAHMEIIDAAPLSSLVSREKDRMLKEQSVKLTFMPFIVKATIEALKENPNFNASYDRDKLEIVRKNYYNIGIAASAADGLKVVVIKDANKKSIKELAKGIQEFRVKLDNNTITLEDMRDTSFTITNIGSLGGGFLSLPMINYPDVAILGTHIIRDRPVVVDGQIKVGKIMPVSLAFDHRVVDGAEAVKFVNAIKKYLEDPDFLEMLD